MRALRLAACAAGLLLAADAFVMPHTSVVPVPLRSSHLCASSNEPTPSTTTSPASTDEPLEVRAVTQSVNARLLDEINASLPRYRTPEGAARLKVQREEVDLNGVQPAMAALGSVGAAAMSAGAWKLTNALAAAYLAQSERFATSDILAVQRLTGFMKQVIVGLGTLATGVFGMTALGMALLAGRVLVGVVKGELDPSAPADARPSAGAAAAVGSPPAAALEDVKELLAKADAEIAAELAQRRRD